MSSAMYLPRCPFFGGTMEYTAESVRGVSNPNHLCSLTRQALSTDPIGNTTVTFTGVNANSEIRVYRADGVELAGVENCSANHALTWSVYAPGSNSVNRIVIVHPNYRIKEFTYTPAVGTTSLPVQQEADKWYSNPA